MARRSEERGFASRNPERRRRIASEGGRSSHGRRNKDYEEEYDDEFDYNEDDGQDVSNRYRGDKTWDEGHDEDDYGDEEYEDEDDRRRSSRSFSERRRNLGRGRRSSGRGFASMDPEARREMGRQGGQSRWESDDDRGKGRSSRRGSSGGRSTGSSGRAGRSNSSNELRTYSSGRSRSGRTGFGSMPREEVRRIALKGGKVSQRGRSRGR